MAEGFEFPVRMPAHAMLSSFAAIALAFDLPMVDETVWFPMVADGMGGDARSDVIGYLELRRAVTLRPGLATYAVVGLRPASEPPAVVPSLASFRPRECGADVVAAVDVRRGGVSVWVPTPRSDADRIADAICAAAATGWSPSFGSFEDVARSLMKALEALRSGGVSAHVDLLSEVRALTTEVCRLREVQADDARLREAAARPVGRSPQ